MRELRQRHVVRPQRGIAYLWAVTSEAANKYTRVIWLAGFDGSRTDTAACSRQLTQWDVEGNRTNLRPTDE